MPINPIRAQKFKRLALGIEVPGDVQAAVGKMGTWRSGGCFHDLERCWLVATSQMSRRAASPILTAARGWPMDLSISV